MAQAFVKSFTHLRDMPRADRALPMLQRVASLVKPIMRKHGWVLPTLSEFFPDTPNLLGSHVIGLNVNGGQQILLRLRPPWSPDTFLDEDAVTRTMLHELTHNVHGPHDEKFYKFLVELEDEYDALQRSGYAGEGFFSPGYRLGTGVSHNLPPHIARARALEAAEKRRRAEMLTKNDGRLGGWSSTLARLSPRELAARAAERRKRDETACGSGSLVLREAAKAAKASAVDTVLMNDSDDTSVTHGASGSKAGSSRSQSSTQIRSTPNPEPSTNRQWTCHVCTLINAELTLQCHACLTVRPIDTSVGWACLACGETDIPHEFWSCRFCGAIKTHS